MPPKTKRSQKKSGKGKEKKLKRKQEQAEIDLALSKVKAAYQIADYMEYFTPFKTYNRNSLSVSITYLKISDVPDSEQKWAYQLLKDNMKEQYVSAGFGWNEGEKWDEFTHESTCFLIAKNTNTSELVGFVSFRFDLDDNIEVVYCYEIHMTVCARQKGLGKFMMQILELIGHKASMKKVVLTVFKENAASNRFFRDKLRYEEDTTSPALCDPYNPQEYTYSILSKSLIKPGTASCKETSAATCTCACAH